MPGCGRCGEAAKGRRPILWEKQDLLRHDPEKLAELIWNLL
ncbi:MAG TPA: hypothetical protein PLE19_10360 [Planctomycetota bacterium]|nr:hypothetical protein [Planctomycetota bacterium]HRR80302.1 hypothetical protein [Planctomycetota bacterium]